MRVRRSIAVAVIAGLSALLHAEAPHMDMSRPPNRLASATSPYLLQHQNNPVDWYPWGEEALSRARAENRPIFLSIGYSACHWCHVMEEESFEDEATAALMNRHFVCIKVDREERPDLDEIYMTAVQMMTGSGGWPMSVWLTPDLEPFYGGTYFPREARHGLPSFQQVLGALANAWQSDRDSLVAQARRVRESIERYLVDRPSGEPRGQGTDPLPRAIADLTERFDSVHGGFSHAPKFPPHRGLVLLLERWRDTRDENLRRMATLTLDRMAAGGMHDQIGGGFHRYATDAAWQVPHFEKMLYDNALLADAYLEGWLATGDDADRGVAREIFAWVLREMTDPGGAFYSSLDADSEGEEGRFYVWTQAQILEVLGAADGALANDYYGITPSGNFEGGTSIPHLELSMAAFAERRKLSLESLRARLEKARTALREARARRPRPHLDDKILTAWNGLMIRALARGSKVLDEPPLRAAAERAAGFLLSSARGPDGLMRVSCRAGKVSPDAFLDDQAFLISGLIALHEAGAGARWLTEAVALTRATEASFGDPAGGLYFFTPPGRTDLIVRTKSATDGAIPSGNSVMASNLLALARLTGEKGYQARAQGILSAAGAGMEAMPGAYHNMLLALREAGGAPAPSAASGKVEVTVRQLESPVRAGGTVRAELTMRVPEGWHVQSATPSLPDLVPTRVTLAPGAVSLIAAEYPEAALRPMGFAGRPLEVLEGTVVIRLTMSVARAAAAGPLAARGEVSYQACDDRSCLPPSRVPFEIGLQVAP